MRRQLAEAASERGVVPGATLANVSRLTAGAGRILDDLGVGDLRLLTAGGRQTRIVLGRVLARVDTLVGRTTAGSGTMGRVLSDPSLYANADSLVTELRALVADVKARPNRYVHIRPF